MFCFLCLWMFRSGVTVSLCVSQKARLCFSKDRENLTVNLMVRWSEFQHFADSHPHICHWQVNQIRFFLFLQHQVLQILMQPKWSWIHHILPHQMSLQPWYQNQPVCQLKGCNSLFHSEDKSKKQICEMTKSKQKANFIPQQSSLFVIVTPDTSEYPRRSTTSHPGSNTFGSVWLQVFWFQIGLASPSTALEAAPPPGLVVLW